MNTFHKVLFVLAILIANCISASAIEFTDNGVRYSINSDNTTVTVAGYPSDSKPTGDLTIPDSVTYGGISFSVTSIGNEAFEYCSGLTSLTIPNSVTSIGSSAFSGCSGLKSVTIPNSVTSIGNGAFWGCSGLTSLTIPNSVTSIGDWAFQYCSGLTSVTIGNSVTSIGEGTFISCSGLTSITIPNSVTAIGNWAFWHCSSLTSVTIPNSVTYIGKAAFDDTAWYNNQPDGLVYAGLVAYEYKGTMPSGTSIVLKEGTKGIAGTAFWRCSGLTSVTIPSSVKYIGREAFSGSNELTELVWNAESCNIGYDSNSEESHPFYSCPIIKLIVGEEVQQIPSTLMYKQIFLKSVIWNAKNCRDFSSGPFYGLTNIKTFEVGSEVERIPAYLCYGLTGLTSVTIPNSVTSIGEAAFDGTAWYNNQPDGLVYAGPVAYKYKGTMASGTSIVLKEGTKGIADEAFYKCSGLTSVTIPNSVTSIGNEAFCWCSGLTSVTIPNSVTSIGGSAFYGTAWYYNQPDGLVYAGLVAYDYKGTMPSGTSIVLKEGTKGIAGGAFYYCSGLTSVIIPNSVTSIGDWAFGNCSGLTRINAYPNPEQVKVSTGGNVFYGVPKDGTLHVLPKYLSAYRTASQWCEFTNIKGDLTEIGDINLDGKVDVSDETTLVNMIANGETANLELADINADGKVNVSDVTALVNIILK